MGCYQADGTANVDVTLQVNGDAMLVLEYDIEANTETVFDADRKAMLTVRYNRAGNHVTVWMY